MRCAASSRLGLVRLGRAFQAISVAVVTGMLSGIGLPLMFSQAYPLADAKAPGTPIENMAGIPGLLSDTLANPQALIAAGLGIVTVVLSFLWKKVPAPINKIPAALVAVGIGIAVAAMPGVNVVTLQVGNLVESVNIPGAAEFGQLADVGIITSILTFTVIASAESLFTAAAVDRMHDGKRTQYNAELIAQGTGNTVAGLPQVIEALEEIAESGKPRIRLDLTRVTHLDHACRQQVDEFVAQQRAKGDVRVELLLPNPPKYEEEAAPASAPALDPLPASAQTAGPSDTAEWFYLDTRPVEETSDRWDEWNMAGWQSR